MVKLVLFITDPYNDNYFLTEEEFNFRIKFIEPIDLDKESSYE